MHTYMPSQHTCWQLYVHTAVPPMRTVRPLLPEAGLPLSCLVPPTPTLSSGDKHPWRPPWIQLQPKELFQDFLFQPGYRQGEPPAGWPGQQTRTQRALRSLPPALQAHSSGNAGTPPNALHACPLALALLAGTPMRSAMPCPLLPSPVLSDTHALCCPLPPLLCFPAWRAGA